MKKNIRKDIFTIIAVTVAAFLMALNTKTFVNTGGLYPGGMTGMSILIQRAVKQLAGIMLPFSIINITLNIIPVYIGFRFIGKKFTAFSCVMILLNSFFTDLIPNHIITQDVLLISLCLNRGATSGGTDFISIYLSEKSNMDTFNVILGFNAVILCVAGFMFGWDKALYSIIFQYASTTVLHMLYKKFQQSTLLIVTNKPKEIADAIYAVSQHGATILDGEGSYEHCERQIVYSVVSAAQTKKIIHAVKEADPKAFINEVKTQKLSGRFYLPKES